MCGSDVGPQCGLQDWLLYCVMLYYTVDSIVGSIVGSTIDSAVVLQHEIPVSIAELPCGAPLWVLQCAARLGAPVMGSIVGFQCGAAVWSSSVGSNMEFHCGASLWGGSADSHVKFHCVVLENIEL